MSHKLLTSWLYVLMVTIVLFIQACNSGSGNGQATIASDSTVQTTKVDQDSAEANRPRHLTYFTASGLEPVWSLEIAEDRISFESSIPGYTRLFAPHEEPVRTVDANLRRYRLETDQVILQVQIRQDDCGVGAGEILPYKVQITIDPGTVDNIDLEGCGNYIPDYRLFDIWSLRTLDGEEITPADFGNEIPRIEINTTKRTFMAFAGCNAVEGKIQSDRQTLQFTDIETTLQACPGNAESPFVKALRAVTRYRLENMRLHLANDSGELLVFQKVD